MLGIVLLGVVCVCLLIGIVVGFISASNDRDRTARLKTEGIHVPVKIVTCIGQLSGSGSSVSGYNCQGSYVVAGKSYQEPIGAKTTFSDTGTIVAGIADPTEPTRVVTAVSVEESHTSAAPYVVEAILIVLFIAMLAWMIILIGRRRNLHKPATPSQT